MTIPLRHFVVSLAFLLSGAVLGTAMATGVGTGFGSLVHVHLLLLGWICVTIMGAMTQFVPVWSGIALHSRRLATAQLWLVASGLVGFAASWVLGELTWLAVSGGVILVGIWVFVYNVARTLARARPLDVTERHFAFALACFVVVPTLGVLLAVDYTRSPFAAIPVTRSSVLLAHATLAVFGAVLSTVVGALYQLASMFTQTELHGVDGPLRTLEEVSFPLGVTIFAVGRGVASAPLARVGAVLLCVGLLAFAVVFARRLYESDVDRTPMLSRYAVVAASLPLWTLLAARTWWADPLASDALLGHPDAIHVLAFGVVGFVVLGTLYHVVPFIVWVHRYSDRLGYESVPMIDDLYDARVAAADFWLTAAGLVAVSSGQLPSFPPIVAVVGGALATAGITLFVYNMLLTIHRHGPHRLRGVLLPGLSDDPTGTHGDTFESTEEADDGGPDPEYRRSTDGTD